MRFYRNCVWSDVNQIYAAMMSPRPAARTSIDIDGLKIKDPDGDALAHLTLLICSFYRRSARYVQKRTADSVAIKECIAELEKNIQKGREKIHTMRDSELDDIDMSHSRKRKKVDERTEQKNTL
ncbi:hypothetical protein QE152_g22556 [Popillia japonica]|uniref:Uncharacterized protein n=1 Tax=Popillia japonica TaxID=7064 RepID=A0AAW1KK49_POPJA